jgi:peptide/nickel transport system substrate-binding protein
MKASRFLLTPFLVLVSVLILVGCAPATPASAPAATTLPPTQAPPTPVPPTAAPTAAKANVAVYAHTTTLPDIDPSVSFSNDSVVTSNAYETLVWYNPPGSKELLQPGLAVKWESNTDGTEWTFFLRQGVKFHDGTDFNAEAVKYSIERTMELGLGASYIWDPVDTITVVDNYTVKFSLKYPAPLDLIAASGYGAWIFSPTTTAAHDSAWFNEGHDAGTGPYLIESYERGQRLIMTRFDDYWGGWKAGQFDQVVFETVEDPTVRQQMIEAGTGDVTYELPRENLASLDARDDVVVYSNPSFQNLLGLLNHRKPPLDNVLVRQAISYAFPYKQFIQNVMAGYAVQSYGPVPAGMWGHSDELFQYSYNLDKAKELLAQAGYPNGGFKLLMTYATGDLDEQQVGELWKAELAKLGIDLEVQGMAWESQWDLAKSDPAKAQDILVFYWWPDYVSPYSFLYNMFHCEDQIAFNLGYYCNPDFDKMIDQGNALSGANRTEAEQLFIEAQKTLVDDAAAVFFYDVANTHVLRADIKGYVDNPAYPHVVFFYQLSR